MSAWLASGGIAAAAFLAGVVLGPTVRRWWPGHHTRVAVRLRWDWKALGQIVAGGRPDRESYAMIRRSSMVVIGAPLAVILAAWWWLA